MTDWTFAGTWPYEPRYYESEDGRMHYVDEGDSRGQAVVLLHGNPTWAYIYRHCIGRLVDAGYRAVAVDHLGFGRSDKPESPGLYTIQRHSQRLRKLIGDLELRDAVFVVHDWAGPIALPILAEDANLARGLILLNTFSPRLPGPMGSRTSLRALRTRVLGPFLVKRRNVPVEQFLFKAGTAKPHAWNVSTKEAYRAPHPTPGSRLPMLVFPKEIPFADDDPVARTSQQTAPRISQIFARRPVRILWGMNDVLFGDEVLEQWQALLPNANTSRIDGAGHFLQEDEPGLTADEIAGFAGKLADRRRAESR